MLLPVILFTYSVCIIKKHNSDIDFKEIPKHRTKEEVNAQYIIKTQLQRQFTQNKILYDGLVKAMFKLELNCSSVKSTLSKLQKWNCT